jgi:uncharacterized membrane protein YphA (DoxX/SURF4 family)
MLSMFPTLLAYPMIGATILRIAVAIAVLILGRKTLLAAKSLQKSGVGTQSIAKAVSIVEILIGLFILIGLWTQVAALLLALLSGILYFTRTRHSAFAIESSLLYIFLALSSLSILFFGAGIIAIDLSL